MLEWIQCDDETRLLIDRGARRLARSAETMAEAWGFGRTERWDADFNAGTITFSSPGLVVIAQVQVVGSLILEDHSWLWSWGNPNVDYELTRHARLVRHYGRTRGIERLNEPELLCTMEDAWHFSALAAQLGEASGAYRGPADGGLYVFMTFDKPTIFRQNCG